MVDGYTDRYAAAHGRFTVVPAAYVFLLRDGQHNQHAQHGPDSTAGAEVLLQLRRGTGYMDEHWAAAAAGHVEAGETAVAAAHRETREEIGVTDVELTFLTAMQRTRHDQAIDERVDFFFSASSWAGEPRILEPTKCAELRWCALDALDDLPQPVVPHERVVLDALRAGTIEGYTTFGF